MSIGAIHHVHGESGVAAPKESIEPEIYLCKISWVSLCYKFAHCQNHFLEEAV